jgi:hypothetical protein
MTSTFEEALKRQGLSWIEPLVHRRFAAEIPEIGAALSGEGVPPWVAPAEGALLARLPIAPCLPSGEGAFFRLPRHARCFHYSPSGGGAAKEVLAIKGTEPLAPDFDGFLYVLEHLGTPELSGSPQRRLGEHFALVEHKVPGALTLREAEDEANAAAEIQSRHLRTYGTLARLPCPLLLVRLPDRVGDELIEKLGRALSSRALARVEPSIRHGLAVYIYYYPALPLRVSHIAATLPRGSFPVRLAELERCVAPPAVIEEWVRQFVRMLYLGFLPVALGSRGTGACCDPNNAVVDGGFVDLDSLLPIDELDRTGKGALFEETLHLSFLTLCETARIFLAKEPTRHEEHLGADVVGRLFARYLGDRVRRALQTEARPELRIDPRIEEYFDPSVSYESLLGRLRDYYPPFALEELFAGAEPPPTRKAK